MIIRVWIKGQEVHGGGEREVRNIVYWCMRAERHTSVFCPDPSIVRNVHFSDAVEFLD